MKPGRELDKLVAEKIFGWNLTFNVHRQEWGQQHSDRFEPVPKYSTDIAAAWMVVERLNSKNISLKLDNDPVNADEGSNSRGREWIAQFWNYGGVSQYGQSETAPHAICLAALNLCKNMDVKST